MLIDTHAHLFWDSFKDDFEQVIDNAKNAGVSIIINVGTDPDTSNLALRQDFGELSRAAQGKLANIPNLSVYSSIGIHPHEYHKYFSNPDVSIRKDIDKLGRVYAENRLKCIAVGECGLDYKQDKDYNDYNDHKYYNSQEIQKKLFHSQIELAKKLDLPLLIHCRDGSTPQFGPELTAEGLTTGAWNDIFEGLEGTKGLFHTFTGSVDDAKTALDLGYYLSFSCMITYPKNENLREVVKLTPLERILTETDSPFLPPQGKRGQRNEPANIVEVIRCIAEIKQLPTEELSLQIYQNAKRLFDF